MRLPRLATRVGSRKVQDPADDSCQEHSQGCPPVETRHRRCVDGVGACGVQGFLSSGPSWHLSDHACPRISRRLLPGFSSSPVDSESREPSGPDEILDLPGIGLSLDQLVQAEAR